MNTENNKLIAEFDGKSVYPKTFKKGGWVWDKVWNGERCEYDPWEIHYHDSYDWIIPVIRKIVEFDLSVFNDNLPNMSNARQMIERISRLKITTSIYELNQNALGFIIWYNKQQPKK